MKVQSNKIQPEFQPIQVQITIESALELEVFKRLANHNITVPQLLYAFDEEKQNKLFNMLGDIYNAI